MPEVIFVIKRTCLLLYRNKTALLITVDHGRGDKSKNQWTEHGSSIPGASDTWFALLGPGISAKGELADLLGLEFTAEHPIVEKVNLK